MSGATVFLELRISDAPAALFPMSGATAFLKLRISDAPAVLFPMSGATVLLFGEKSVVYMLIRDKTMDPGH